MWFTVAYCSTVCIVKKIKALRSVMISNQFIVTARTRTAEVTATEAVSMSIIKLRAKENYQTSVCNIELLHRIKSINGRRANLSDTFTCCKNINTVRLCWATGLQSSSTCVVTNFWGNNQMIAKQFGKLIITFSVHNFLGLCCNVIFDVTRAV